MLMQPIEKNRNALKEWILKFFASSVFNTCTHQKQPEMSGVPLEIKFKEHSKLMTVHTPIPIPHHYRKKVKEALDADTNLGVVEPVPQGVPTT